jgi:hypothetical protein
MNANRLRYQAYLLRLWQVRVGEGFEWRASLEIPGCEGRMGFPNLESLFRYLLDTTQGSIEEEKGKELKTIP